MNEFLGRLKEQVSTIVGRMSSKQRAVAAGGLALFAIALVALILAYGRTEFQPLYTGLRTDQAGEILSVLKEQGIQYQLADGGRTILVPKDDVYELRLQLASSGLPTGGVVGLELWDNIGLGETEFDRRVKYLRALQGELTRTILSIDAVSNARVHIVLPERSLFTKQAKEATASVLIELKPGRLLTPEQVQAIAHIMATSVEGLSPERVTIVDNRGNILNPAYTDKAAGVAAGMTSALDVLETKRAFEREMEQSLQAMLERVFGYGRVALRVNAELNMDYQEDSFEIYEPVVDDEGLVVGEQYSLETYEGSGTLAGGVAGVASNVPGYVTADQPEASRYSKEDVTRNYAVNRKTSRILRAPGRVERLSVAVWIDGELPPSRKEVVVNMVSSALGLVPERGDMVTVDTMRFEPLPGTGIDLVQQAMSQQWPWWLILVGVALTLTLLATAIRQRRRAAAVGQSPVIDVTIGDVASELEEGLEEPAVSEREQVYSSLKKMVDEDPEEFVAILRTWLSED